MDDYPKKLAPARDAFGAIDTERFHEWWSEASKFYSNVPEEAARYWIGRRDGLPIALVLMEGHMRFNIALHLLSDGRLAEKPGSNCGATFSILASRFSFVCHFNNSFLDFVGLSHSGPNEDIEGLC